MSACQLANTTFAHLSNPYYIQWIEEILPEGNQWYRPWCFLKLHLSLKPFFTLMQLHSSPKPEPYKTRLAVTLCLLSHECFTVRILANINEFLGPTVATGEAVTHRDRRKPRKYIWIFSYPVYFFWKIGCILLTQVHGHLCAIIRIMFNLDYVWYK